jgi:hypothetical protein
MTDASADAWGRFRQRLMADNQQDRYLEEWSRIRRLTQLPPHEALEALRAMISAERMDEPAFQLFRNAMVLVNAAYTQRAGVGGISDPAEWQRRWEAYCVRPDSDAVPFEAYFRLRVEIDSIRKPRDQQPPYSPDELSLSAACNALYNQLAVALLRAGPGLAAQPVIDTLAQLIRNYQSLLAQSAPENRARRQAREAIAEAQYAAGRTCLILSRYQDARGWFQDALSTFEALGDLNGAQSSRQQLVSLAVVESGDVDAAVRANLEVLTGDKTNARTLDRATALAAQLRQSLKVGDTFEATALLSATVEALRQQQYLDPGRAPVESYFGQWVESVPGSLEGNDFLRELGQVVQLYAEVYGARAMLSTWPEAGEQLQALSALVNRMGAESLSADRDLQRRFTLASARPLASEGTEDI